MRSLMTWTPRSLAQDAVLDRFFDDFFQTPGLPARNWLPAADIVESEDHYTLSLDLPGFRKEDLAVTIEDGMLTVRGTRRAAEHDEKSNLVRSERYVGEFARSFRLGDALDTSSIEAHYRDGVLSLRVPKAEQAKARQIEVK